VKTLSDVKAEYLNEALSSPVGGYVVMDRNGKVAAHSNSEFVHCFVDPLDLEAARAAGYECKDEEIDGRVLTWVTAKEKPSELFRSADGGYYTEANLPERDDAFVTERYAQTVRSERNARISDTDCYIQLTDMTVQKESKVAREALTDEERAEVMTYREALRDMPAQKGFPFVEYPTMPACIAYECGQKAESRAMQANMYRGF
jgi:hypothetical protein